MQNYPEYSFCLKCAKWDYKNVQFVFVDEEEDKIYKVDRPMLKNGLKTLRSSIGKPGGVSSKCWDGAIEDAGNWDSVCTDALVQCAIFGKVIYG